MSETNDPLTDDRLDQALQSARWPQPDAAAEARLLRRWRMASFAARWGGWCAVAAAVGLIAIVGVTWHYFLRPAGPVVVEKRPERPTPVPKDRTKKKQTAPETHPPTHPDRVVQAKQPSRDRGVAPRPPTVYEQIVFSSRQKRRIQPPAKSISPGRPVRERRDPLQDAIAKLSQDADADFVSLTKPLMRRRASYERRLLKLLRKSEQAEQQAAIRLLGYLGSARSIPMLGYFYERDATHVAATRALARLADAAMLGQMAQHEADSVLKREILATLLARGDPTSVQIYLGFVRSSESKHDALEALKLVAQPPAAELLLALGDSQRSQRLAAATVLARLDDPIVFRRLMEMVLENVHRQEALLVLMASTRAEVARFLLHASRDHTLVAFVRAARLQYDSLDL